MNIKLIVMTFLLSACSLTSFKDKTTQNSPPIEKRNSHSNANTNINNTNAIVNKIDEPVIEVRKEKITDSADPNKLFKNYSIYFDLDEYTVKEKFLPIIKQHADFLIKNPDHFVFIEGHTDERGGAEYNVALGQKRANAVRVLLLLHGVKENQLEAYSYGFLKPKAFGSNEEAWSQNRRVDFFYKN
jgi:peptidoglycan-associated lipoprotein